MKKKKRKIKNKKKKENKKKIKIKTKKEKEKEENNNNNNNNNNFTKKNLIKNIFQKKTNQTNQNPLFNLPINLANSIKANILTRNKNNNNNNNKNSNRVIDSYNSDPNNCQKISQKNLIEKKSINLFSTLQSEKNNNTNNNYSKDKDKEKEKEKELNPFEKKVKIILKENYLNLNSNYSNSKENFNFNSYVSKEKYNYNTFKNNFISDQSSNFTNTNNATGKDVYK